MVKPCFDFLCQIKYYPGCFLRLTKQTIATIAMAMTMIVIDAPTPIRVISVSSTGEGEGLSTSEENQNELLACYSRFVKVLISHNVV